MNPTTINLTVTAKSPIVHGDFGPKIGNAIAFRRQEIRGVPTPVISGNALCGVIRRLIWRHVFEAQGLNRETMEARQWDRLYGALANGGHLEKAEVATDPDRQRELRQLLPPHSALGAALFSFMMAGNASFPNLVPITDDDPELLIEEVGLARHVDRGEQDPKNSGVTPMPVEIETLKVGTVLTGQGGGILWLAKPHTEAEVGCVVWALDRLSHIGGKGHVGFGRISVEHDGPAEAREAFETWVADPSVADVLRSLAESL